jgi:hypothetical protein
MILRRIVEHMKQQQWTAVFIELAIVVLGVFIGMQVSNWNAERQAQDRRAKVTQALLTDLKDAANVQHDVIAIPIREGLSAWAAAFARGEQPPPFYLRVPGSDTAPDTWGMLQQEQLSELFDPITLFDLGFYYSELDGVGRKYIRYVTFVENTILPNLKADPSVFYTDDGKAIKPIYAASMDRLREFGLESEKFEQWADCLIYRIESNKSFDALCRRNGFRLDGMQARHRSSSGSAMPNR